MPTNCIESKAQISADEPVKRVFIALPFAHKSNELLHSHMYEESCVQRAGLRWVTPNNLHLTLVFIGAIATQRVQEVCSVIGQVAARCKEFSISFGSIAPFPADHRSMLLVAMPQQCDALFSLQVKLTDSLRPLHLMQEEHEYLPHVTLARCKQPQKDLPSVLMRLHYTATELHLYASEQTNAGVNYRSLYCAALQE